MRFFCVVSRVRLGGDFVAGRLLEVAPCGVRVCALRSVVFIYSYSYAVGLYFLLKKYRAGDKKL